MPETANPKLRSPTAAVLPAPPPDAPPYAELCVASNFTFLRGASHPDELVFRAAEFGYRAIGITDLNSFAGIVRMHVAAKHAGLKLLIGVRLAFIEHPDILVWPRNRAAYGRLCMLLTEGKRRTTKGNCDLYLQEFLEHSEEVHAAYIPPTILTPACAGRLRTLKETLGPRLSIAASCLYESDNQTRLADLIALSRAANVPLLATNDVHYHLPERRALHDVLTCIRHGCTIHDAGLRLFQNGERYLKTPAQMHALFIEHPQAIRRGLEIAADCSFNLQELRYDYPREVSPDGRTPLEYLAELSWSGAKERYPQGIPEKVRALIERELTLIGELKIEAYFLTVYDLVHFARGRGILCQGRGSAANSAVCYCLGVTSVDPARIDVLFERFVSSARNEPPDIDIDFEHERREEVIQYVYEKYGRQRAGMTAEVITYRGRSAVRDVGKALGLGLDAVDQMAKKLDWWDKGALTAERAGELGFDINDRTIGLVMRLTGEVLGFPRHLSQHVGGMVMTSGLLCEMVPIENASMPDRTVIEWDKQDIDDLGILKVDLLGLGMLTCIVKSLEFIRRTRPNAPPLEMYAIPAEDPAVYEMMSDADTVGVFQIESRAQMSMLPRLKPKEFYDLVIEVAIVRPGPIQGDLVHPYLRRRQGLEPVEYPRESLRRVLGKTLGVPLFQEQAMRIAIECAGFTPEDADRLRRAVTGFRRYGHIETFAGKFITGMRERGFEEDFAQRCFAQLRGFASYGFPESHAASFALLVYISAWIKRHHPAAFCAGLLNSQPMGFYAPAQIVRDAQLHGVAVLPVDVHHSDWDCTLEAPAEVCGGDITPKWDWGRGGPSVRLGLRTIRGLARRHADQLVASRVGLRVGSYLRVGSRPPEMPIREQSLPGSQPFPVNQQSISTNKNQLISHSSYPPLFTSHPHFARASALPAHAIVRLAQADAFGSLNLSRRQALWEAMAIRDEKSPLFDFLEQTEPERRESEQAGTERRERSDQSAVPDGAEFNYRPNIEFPDNPEHSAVPDEVIRAIFTDDNCPKTPADTPDLPLMPLSEEVAADYQTAGLSLKRHPVALVRPLLKQKGILSSADLLTTDAGRWVKVAGLVLIRQRPGTASGIVFETLEDETGIINLIIRPDIYERNRPAARHATFAQADGYVERQGKVIHIMVKRMHDLSHLLRNSTVKSRDFR